MKQTQTKNLSRLSKADVQMLRGCVAEVNVIRYQLINERSALLEQSSIDDDTDMRVTVTLIERADIDLAKATNSLIDIVTLLSKRFPNQKPTLFESIRKLI